jgi:hypothetical protein
MAVVRRPPLWTPQRALIAAQFRPAWDRLLYWPRFDRVTEDIRVGAAIPVRALGYYKNINGVLSWMTDSGGDDVTDPSWRVDTGGLAIRFETEPAANNCETTFLDLPGTDPLELAGRDRLTVIAAFQRPENGETFEDSGGFRVFSCGNGADGDNFSMEGDDDVGTTHNIAAEIVASGGTAEPIFDAGTGAPGDAFFAYPRIHVAAIRWDGKSGVGEVWHGGLLRASVGGATGTLIGGEHTRIGKAGSTTSFRRGINANVYTVGVFEWLTDAEIRAFARDPFGIVRRGARRIPIILPAAAEDEREAVLAGSILSSTIETDIQTGGKIITYEVTGDSWIPA